MEVWQLVLSIMGVLYLMFGGIVADEIVRIKNYEGIRGKVGVVVFVMVFWSVLLVWSKIKVKP